MSEWKSDTEITMEDIKKAKEIMEKSVITKDQLFKHWASLKTLFTDEQLAKIIKEPEQ